MEEDRLFKSILPILQLEQNKRFIIAGTAVLVEHRQTPFLVTAGHVLRRNGSKYPLYLSLDKKAVLLGGPALISKEELGIDLAVFNLSHNVDVLSHLNGCATISLESPDQLPEHSRSHYYIFGYPTRKGYHNIDDECFTAKPLDYITDEADDSQYQKYNKQKRQYLLLDYNPKNTKNQGQIKTIAPNPQGVSGGAVFHTLVNSEDEIIMYIFESIPIEWKGKKVVVSTRKSELKAFIDGKISSHP